MRLLHGGQVDETVRELQQARNDPLVRMAGPAAAGHCFKAPTTGSWPSATSRRHAAAAQQREVVRKELLYLLAQGAADNGDLQKTVDLGNELANEDFTFRDIGRLLDEWQHRLEQEQVG